MDKHGAFDLLSMLWFSMKETIPAYAAYGSWIWPSLPGAAKDSGVRHLCGLHAPCQMQHELHHTAQRHWMWPCNDGVSKCLIILHQSVFLLNACDNTRMKAMILYILRMSCKHMINIQRSLSFRGNYEPSLSDVMVNKNQSENNQFAYPIQKE